MVIRYTCTKCKSVLKISKDLAGTDGKCPKCKVSFKVPEGDEEAASADATRRSEPVAVAAEGDQDEFGDAIAALVDMPREVTPQVDFTAMDDFDPISVLDSEAAGAATPAAPEAPKPSVAELMREHEEAKKKKNAAKKKDKGSLAAAAAAADVMTAGTAASALTRTYDKKRSGTADAPPLTRDERRQAEQMEAAVSFAWKAIPASGVVLICGYFLLGWAFSAPLPDLEYVTGVVTRDSAPLVGVTVQFQPLSPAGGMPLENATPSTGITDENGEFVMMYDPENPGVLPGEHQVTISTVSGLALQMSPDEQIKTVSSDSREFQFRL